MYHFCLGKVRWCTASARIHVWKDLVITNGMRVSESSAINETKIKGAAHLQGGVMALRSRCRRQTQSLKSR